MELIVKHKQVVAEHVIRLGLDPHGRCWIVGHDLGLLIGKRFPHIPKRLHAVDDAGTHLAQFEVLRHWQTTGRANTNTLKLGNDIMNHSIPAMCERLYGPRVVTRDQLNQGLDEEGNIPLRDLLRLFEGDHHLYSTLVRQAFGAIQIQRDAGPFAPHHLLTGVMFDVSLDSTVKVLPQGIAGVLKLLHIEVRA